jgi:multidrug transporter EmrE-like cation transporter
MLQIGMALGAALAFTVGGIFMKPTQGLTRPWPTVAVLGLFTVGALLLTLSVSARGELGTAYLFVLGLETVLAFAFGMLIFGERAGAGRILGLVLLLVGMVLIEHGGADGSAEPVTQRIANEARVE